LFKLFNKKSFPFYKQVDQFDCGPACLRIIAKYYGKNFSSEHLRDVCNITSDGITIKSLINGAEELGFQAMPAKIDYETLSKKAPIPCICYWRDRHFLIVYKFENNKVYVSDPSHGLIVYSKQEFLEGWLNTKNPKNDDEGVVVLLEPTPEFRTQEDTNFSVGLKALLPYLKGYNNYIFQIFIGLLVGSVIQLMLPVLTQKLVDTGINLNDVNFIYIILIAQLSLFFGQSFLQVIRGWLLLFIGSRISIFISSDYLNKLFKKSLSFFDSKTPGDILQRINESSRIENFLTTVPENIFSYFNSLIFLAVLGYYSWMILVVFSIGIAIYTLWVGYFMKRRKELDFKRFDESSGLNSSLIQLVNGIQEVKVNLSEKRHIWDWEKVRVKYYKTSISSLKLTQLQDVGGSLINQIKNIIVTFLAAIMVVEGQISLGELIAIQFIIGQLNAPLMSLVNFFRSIQDARLSLERFEDIDYITPHEKILNDKTAVDIPKIPYDISINNLSFSYVNDKTELVLKNINLTIPKGKITAIVGDSGSGKTTLLKLLLKLYIPYEGQINVNDNNLNNISTRSWRSLCGTVMQDGHIFSGSVADNITESKAEVRVDTQNLLNSVKIANLEELINALPSGFGSQIGSGGGSGRALSGGQKQRLLIARAIYKDPKYLFFDEATSALDANNEKKIVENLNDFFTGKTVVIIAHRLSTVRQADQIVVLNKGEIKEIGTHQELVEKKDAYYKLIKNQLELGN
jgi:ATP-binding cassette subfamily B protein